MANEMQKKKDSLQQLPVFRERPSEVDNAEWMIQGEIQKPGSHYCNKRRKTALNKCGRDYAHLDLHIQH